MKRTSVAGIASALAISSAIVAPSATAGDAMPESSSEIRETGWTYAVMNNALWGENTSSIQPWADEYKEGNNRNDYFEKGHPGRVIESSVANDGANDWKLGTTLDIILGTGIAALVLALAAGAYNAGLIQLP
mgnify:CR=1 FL=1